MEAVDFESLRRAPIFHAMGDSEFEALLGCLRERQLNAGDVVFEQGQAGDAMLVLASGRLSVCIRGLSGGKSAVGEILPGGVVGEMACLDEDIRSATVVAAEPSRVLELDRAVLRSLASHAPGVAATLTQGIVDQISQRLRATNRRLAEVQRQRGGNTQPAVTAARPAGPPAAPLDTLVRDQLGGTPPDQPGALSDEDLDRLLDLAKPRTYRYGDLLCKQGELGHSVFALLHGQVEVRQSVDGAQRLLALLDPGSLVGQLSPVDTLPRTATVVAAGQVVALELDWPLFERLMERGDVLASRLQERIALATISQLRLANSLLAWELLESESSAAYENDLQRLSPLAAPPRRHSGPMTLSHSTEVFQRAAQPQGGAPAEALRREVAGRAASRQAEDRTSDVRKSVDRAGTIEIGGAPHDLFTDNAVNQTAGHAPHTAGHAPHTAGHAPHTAGHATQIAAAALDWAARSAQPSPKGSQSCDDALDWAAGGGSDACPRQGASYNEALEWAAGGDLGASVSRSLNYHDALEWAAGADLKGDAATDTQVDDALSWAAGGDLVAPSTRSSPHNKMGPTAAVATPPQPRAPLPAGLRAWAQAPEIEPPAAYAPPPRPPVGAHAAQAAPVSRPTAEIPTRAVAATTEQAHPPAAPDRATQRTMLGRVLRAAPPVESEAYTLKQRPLATLVVECVARQRSGWLEAATSSENFRLKFSEGQLIALQQLPRPDQRLWQIAAGAVDVPLDPNSLQVRRALDADRPEEQLVAAGLMGTGAAQRLMGRRMTIQLTRALDQGWVGKAVFRPEWKLSDEQAELRPSPQVPVVLGAWGASKRKAFSGSLPQLRRWFDQLDPNALSVQLRGGLGLDKLDPLAPEASLVTRFMEDPALTLTALKAEGRPSDDATVALWALVRLGILVVTATQQQTN